MSECCWCSRKFTPRDPSTPSHYALLSAGLSICWHCADLYDAAEIKLHVGPVKAEVRNDKVVTDNGYQLPIAIYTWYKSLNPWRSFGQAVDHYGKIWHVSMKPNNLVTLKPIGT